MDISDNAGTGRHYRTLLIIALLFCAFHAVLYAASPPHDGDSYDYAAIARNVVRYSELREDTLRAYSTHTSPHAHPASERGSLYVFLLAPFHAVFGDTHWTFTVPSLIGLFLLPLVTYGTGKKYFDPDAAYIAAILTLFSPSLLRVYDVMDPGLPEVWLMIIFLSFASALLDGNFFRAGILMGIAFLVKKNAAVMIPATLLWLALCRPRILFSRGAVLLFSVALLTIMPFLVRNQVLFGNPVHSEHFTGLATMYDPSIIEHFRNGDIFELSFSYSLYNQPDKSGSAITPASVAKGISLNALAALRGYETDVFYIPGFPQAVGLLMLPFLAAGALRARRNHATVLSLLLCFFMLLMHAIAGPYSDRYLLPVMPLALLVGASGIISFAAFAASRHRLSRRHFVAAIVLFMLISESCGFIIMSVMRASGNPRETPYAELRTACDYIRQHTAPDTVIMTYPFSATHFLCDRSTIPFPYDSLATAATAAKRYNAQYIFFAEIWPVDSMPEPPFAITVARGMRLSVFRIDKKRLDGFTEDPGASPLSTLNPVRHFIGRNAAVEIAPPLYKMLVRFSGGAIPGYAAYFALCIGFVSIYTILRGRYRLLPVILLIVATAAIQIANFSRLFAPYMAPRPEISPVEIASILSDMPSPAKYEPLTVLPLTRGASAATKQLRQFFPAASLSARHDPGLPQADFIFYPIDESRRWLYDSSRLKQSISVNDTRRETIKRITASHPGMTVIPVYGGILLHSGAASGPMPRVDN